MTASHSSTLIFYFTWVLCCQIVRTNAMIGCALLNTLLNTPII